MVNERGLPPSPDAPRPLTAEEALERTIRQLHAMAVATDRSGHRRGSHLHCLNRMCKEAVAALDAARLGSPDPDLDVERLRLALLAASRQRGWLREDAAFDARLIAAEYARLRSEEPAH